VRVHRGESHRPAAAVPVGRFRESEIKPKGEFVKVERLAEPTAEESALATLSFGDKQDYVIHANIWARPT